MSDRHGARSPGVEISSRYPDGHLGADEGAFQAAVFEADRRRLRALVWVTAVFTALLLGLWELADAGPGPVERALALTILALSLVAAAGLGGVRTRRSRDLVGGLWYGAVAAALAAIFTVGVPRPVHAAALLLMVAGLALFPISFPARVLPSALVGLAALWSGVRYGAGASLADAQALLGSFAVGLWASLAHQRVRRSRFAASLAAAEAEQEAEAASSLLPVCAWCRQVRTDDGFWRAAVDHLRHRLPNARPALCGDCRRAGRRPDVTLLRPPTLDVEALRRHGGVAGRPAAAAAEPAAFDPAAFRRWNADGERRGLRVLLICGILFIGFGMVRVALAGVAPEFAVIGQTVRVGLIVLLLGSLLALRSSDDARVRDVIALGIGMGTAVALALAVVLAPRAPAITSVLLVVFAFYLLLTVPLILRTVPALLLTGVAIADLWASPGSPLAGFAGNAVLSLLFANGIGFWMAHANLQEQREAFVAFLRERRARAERERIDDLLPICAACGDVRDDDGYWSDVVDLLERRGAVQASHGICPSCFDEQDAPAARGAGEAPAA
jgi:hypothetical protein